jgi:hypothetical protein
VPYNFLSNPILFASKVLVVTPNKTTDTELIGIKIAASKGERLPEAAKLIPTILYIKAMIYAAKINFLDQRSGSNKK